MATTYELVIYDEEAEYAAQAAWAAWQMLDQLEDDLSRYRPNSDISRINVAAPGQVLRIGPDAFACLECCQEIYEKSNGVFDITAGALITAWREADKKGVRLQDDELAELAAKTGMAALLLNATDFTVAVTDQGVTVDLGGFGKGYAVDQMCELLADEWEIENFLIHGGSSSVLARGALGKYGGWPVSLSHPNKDGVVLQELLLRDETLSGSGLQKGHHIVDPRNGQPAQHHDAAWVIAASAAVGDALSTTLMMCTMAEAEAICRQFPGLEALLLPKGAEGVLQLS